MAGINGVARLPPSLSTMLYIHLHLQPRELALDNLRGNKNPVELNSSPTLRNYLGDVADPAKQSGSHDRTLPGQHQIHMSISASAAINDDPHQIIVSLSLYIYIYLHIYIYIYTYIHI